MGTSKITESLGENKPVDLMVTDHETGKSYYIKSGPHLALHAEAMERVKNGQDAWTRARINHERSG